MQGEEGEKGTSTFQSTRLVGPILTGGLASAATPELFGPRKAGQESAAPWAVKQDAATPEQNNARTIMDEK